MVLQIVLVIAALAALAYFVRSGQSVGVRASKRLAFGGFVLLNVYAVLRPNDVTWVARHLGIGRGTDLIVYLLVVAFVFGMLNTYLRDREISRHLTDLARQIAIRDAELARREAELTDRLREVTAALEQTGGPGARDDVARVGLPNGTNGSHAAVGPDGAVPRPEHPHGG